MPAIMTVTKNVLVVLYQYFWISLFLTFVLTMCYLYVFEDNKSGNGLKSSIKLWLTSFRTSSRFRLLFFLILYSALIGFRTVFIRELYFNPLRDVFGGWWIYSTDVEGETFLTTECIENLMLFIPFSFLLYWYLYSKNKDMTKKRVLFVSIRAVVVFSLVIEFSQLFLKLGTFQFSDLVYNISGGIIGSFISLLFVKIFIKT